MLIEAHQSEVTAVDFSNPLSGFYLLATAGNDRLVHVFDASRDFSLVHTFDEHLAAVSTALFVFNLGHECLRLLSCSSDKSLVFRQVVNVGGEPSFLVAHQVDNNNFFSPATLIIAGAGQVQLVGHEH